jgi:ABC-2 type transport system permease protein
MKRILIDLKASLKTFRRDKSTVFWTIAFPAVLILLFGAIFSQSAMKYDLYIQNQDQVGGVSSYWSDNLLSVLNQTNAFNLQIIDSSVNGTDYALTNRLNVLLIIPLGFNNSANAALYTNGATNASMTIVYDQSTSSAPIVQSIVRSIVDKFNFQLSQGIEYITIEGLAIAPKHFTFIDYFIPGVIGMTAMTTSIFTAVSVSAKFKQNGIFHKLATTPLKRYEWILSRTIYNVLISYLGMAIMIVLGTAIFGMTITIDAIVLLLVAMTSLTFTGLGMIIARFVKDPEGADAAANVIAFPMMFLSGIFFQLSQMPPFLQTIAQALPLTYVGEGLRAAMIFGQTQQALFNTAIVSILGVAFIVVGSLISRWEEN